MSEKSDLCIGFPVRTCFGCRSRKNTGDLLRFTAESINAMLVPDGKMKSPGRGVYCCKNSSCLARFIRNRKGLKKSLRVETLDVSGVEHLFRG